MKGIQCEFEFAAKGESLLYDLLFTINEQHESKDHHPVEIIGSDDDNF